EPAPTRFEDRYEAALDRLEQAERRLDQIEVMVVESRLEGEPAAVEVLRFGGASAWWRAFDGERFGVVRVVDGEVRLEPKTGAGLAERVELAFDIAKGRAAPELVVLPLAPLTPGGPSS
ncbi:MAG TPA: hypothetical protein RMH99_00910, partial [Sandaracinaceae bacterium LLY-WYZ-13_1]|nr:hypothetical protein [Sandaracinaceae bacterium LLY-WYZ-13_1]